MTPLALLALLAAAGAGAAAWLTGEDDAPPVTTSAVSPTTTPSVPATTTEPEAGTTTAARTTPRPRAALPLATFPSDRCRFPYPRGWRVDSVDAPADGAYRSIALSPTSDARVVCEVVPDSRESAGSAAARLRSQGSSAPGFVDLSFRRGPQVGGRPAWRWDFAQRVGGTQVRTSQLFFDGGTLLVQAPTGVHADLRPTVNAIFARFGRA